MRIKTVIFDLIDLIFKVDLSMSRALSVNMNIQSLTMITSTGVH